MYGSISTQQHKKYLSLVSYKITGDNIGIISGFFRVLSNAIKLRNIQLSTIQTSNSTEVTWVDLLTKSLDGVTVDVSKLHIQQQDIQQSQSSVNFMKIINSLIMSLPNQLRDLFVVRMQCQSCSLIQSTVTTLLNQKCSKCGSQLRIIKTPTLLFQDPTNKDIPLKDKLLDNKLYVLNSVFTAKKEENDLISYNVLVDFMFLQNTEMFILNIVDSSQMRPSLTELTYLKGEKMRQYLAANNSQTAIYKKCGKPAVVCYFLYDDLTSFAQKNIQAEMDIEPEVILARSVTKPAPVVLPQLPQLPQLTNMPNPDHYRYVRKQIEEYQPPVQRPVQAQSLQKPRFMNCGWILIGILGLSMLFFLIAMIIMIVIFVKLTTSISLNGAIIQSKLFMTQAVQSPSQISAYLQSLPEPPATYQSSRPGIHNESKLQQNYTKQDTRQIQKLTAQNTPNGIYIDNVTSQKIVSNFSKVDILSGMKQYCAKQQIENLTQLPQNLTINANTVDVTNLTVTNQMNVTQSLTFGTSINIQQLNVVGQLNTTKLSGTGSGNIQNLNCTGQFQQETLTVTNGNFSTYSALDNVTVQNSVSGSGFQGSTFQVQSINPGCTYQCNGTVYATQLYINGLGSELVFGETATLQNSLVFDNTGAILRLTGTNFSATTSLSQSSGTMYGDLNAQQLTATTMTVQNPLTVPAITSDTTTAQTTNVNEQLTSQQSTLTTVQVTESLTIPGVLSATTTGTTLTATTTPLQLGSNMQLRDNSTITFINGTIAQPVLFSGPNGITQNQNLSFGQATINGQASTTNPVQITGAINNQGTLNTQAFITDSLTTQNAITVQNSFMSLDYKLTNYAKNPVIFADTDSQIKAWFDTSYSTYWKVQGGKIEQCNSSLLGFLKK